MAAKSHAEAPRYKQYEKFLMERFKYGENPDQRLFSATGTLNILHNAANNDESKRIIQDVKNRFDTSPEFIREISTGKWSANTLRYIKDFIQQIVRYQAIRIILDAEIKEDMDFDELLQTAASQGRNVVIIDES